MDTVMNQSGSIWMAWRAFLQRQIALLSALALTLLSVPAFSAAITDIEFNSQANGSFLVRLNFDAPPPEPKGYNIERPARIALDFDGVSSKLQEKKFALSYDNASSVVVLESGDRTRMILNLVELAPYTTRIDGNSMIIEVGNAGARDYLKPQKESALVSQVTKADESANVIKSVDFNRGELGEGILTIELSDPKTDVNVYLEGQDINVDFSNLALPERFQRNYDVGDFATPVQGFRAAAKRNGAIFSLKTSGQYDYLAYQADNKYVVSVKPLTPDEVEERNKEFAFVGEKLSLNFQDIEVRAVLQLIADFTSLNLVASDTVQGRITLRLQNVPWDQALELVLKTKGLDKRQVGNVLMVAPAAEIAERERIEIENNKQIEELAPLQTEYIRIRYASASDLFDLFKGEKGGSEDTGESSASLLSSRGSVIVDKRTNSLLITETAQKLQEMRRMIKLLDVPIRQVLVEARIVIANSNFDEQLGVEWGVGGFRQSGNGDQLYFGGSNEGILEANNTNVEAEPGDPFTFPPALNVDMGLGGDRTGQMAIGFITEDIYLAAELSALESQGRGEIVSQPKVITGDKQEAEIKSGSEVPYQESSANGETTISFKEAVLKLNVTPSITPDDRIIMKLQINQDSVGELVPSGNGGFVPTIDTTSLTTQVLVGNGETVVLGGVFRTLDVESESKIPILGDIPYLGRLFKATSVAKEKSETLIFITPRILADVLTD